MFRGVQKDDCMLIVPACLSLKSNEILNRALLTFLFQNPK
jgi:hypothetical protein